MKNSNFKKYFNLEARKKNIKTLFSRFSEKFFRDPWFRVKVILPLFTFGNNMEFKFRISLSNNISPCFE
jgi:hypothetical protein